MPISENELKSLKNLDDARLKDVIMQICDAVGADRQKAELIAADPSGVRETLGKMSADDVNRLLDKAGRDRSRQVLDSLRKQG